jgi:hypothetical protein
MPKIVEEKAYNGAIARIARLGLTPLLNEVREIVSGFQLLVKESRDANGGATLRRLIDSRFQQVGGWTKRQTGATDWTKCHVINGARVCLGVEVQTSGRSDLIVIDLIHLRRDLTEGQIDVGILVVPSDRLGIFLTDRGPKMADAMRHVEAARAEDLPLILIAIEHDGPGAPLPKQRKKAKE